MAGEHPRETVRLAIVYAVCYRFRVPIFRRLTGHPGLTVRIFVGEGIPGTKTQNAENRAGLDVRILRTFTRLVQSGERRVPLSFSPLLPFHLARYDPDVLLVQGGELLNNLLVLAYAKLFGKPVVWWSLGEIRGRTYTGLSAYYRRLVQSVERRCTAWLGYSSVAVDYFHRMGYPPERCFNLVNVVDTDLVEQSIGPARLAAGPLRKQWDLEGRLVLLYVGALTETKRIDRLIEAFARIARDREDVRLLVVGDGPMRAPAEALARERGVADRIVFTGAVYEGVAAYFQAADLLVVPGTGGLVVSEAMAHGLPVICSVGDGSEIDLIEPGRNGYLLPEAGVDVLAEAVLRCLADPDRLAAFGRHSRRIIEERHNISTYMREMLACIFFAAGRQPEGAARSGEAVAA